MKLYNTMTRKKEEFIPIQEGKVGIYVCGPTVYDRIHMGNARPMIVFDTLRRYLTYQGYDVNYVSNFTDVDDKIIHRANEEGVESSVISERYIEEAKKDMAGLNVQEATVHPKATEEIPEMLAMIQTLMDKGYAYEVNGTVYFRTRKFKDYGKLSHKKLDELMSGSRSLKVSGEEEKEDSLDFVLWKPKKKGEPAWASPWGEGRPGWHLECSCMAKKYIGNVIDIHAGGEDLIFPHHENEIAQSEAANGTEFARYWMHNAFLRIDNEKMSKSLGNFFTVREIGERYPLQVIRFFMLSAHYRSPLNFSDELIEAAKNGLERILTGYEKAKAAAERAMQAELREEERENLQRLEALKNKFEEAMDDDLNTADAISVIFEIVRLSNTTVGEASSKAYCDEFLHCIGELCGILGLETEREQELLADEIEALIEERTQARKQKDFSRADAIRNLLLEKGIALEDTREGVKWKRI